MFLLHCDKEPGAQEDAGTELENGMATCLFLCQGCVARSLVGDLEPLSSKLLTSSVPPTTRPDTPMSGQRL